jgi:hypothetical protein
VVIANRSTLHRHPAASLAAAFRGRATLCHHALLRSPWIVPRLRLVGCRYAQRHLHAHWAEVGSLDRAAQQCWLSAFGSLALARRPCAQNLPNRRALHMYTYAQVWAGQACHTYTHIHSRGLPRQTLHFFAPAKNPTCYRSIFSQFRNASRRKTKSADCSAFQSRICTILGSPALWSITVTSWRCVPYR